MTRTYADGIEDAARVADDLVEQMDLACYDAGLLGDGGGGDVGWWQDYIRTELQRAHEFYQDQVAARTLSTSPSAIEVAREALTGWQPIETAPRMEPVLVAGGDASYPVTASWTGLSDECWCIDGQENTHEEIGWPTHWMPLPAPPLCESASSKIGGDHG